MPEKANRPSLDDYVDVAERIATFKESYPEGSLQAYDVPEIKTVKALVQTRDKDTGEVTGTTEVEQTFVVYTAAAYRHPEDNRPGIGTAWEPFPGRTPYTKDSELMNAETAAWGRAIVAVGLASNRKIASRQEVQARRAEEQEAKRAAMTDHAKELLAEADKLAEQLDQETLPTARYLAFKHSTGYTEEGLERLVEYLRERVPEEAKA